MKAAWYLWPSREPPAVRSSHFLHWVTAQLWKSVTSRWRCGFCGSPGIWPVQLVLNILLYDLNITLLCILKRLNVRATDGCYRILDIRRM